MAAVNFQITGDTFEGWLNGTTLTILNQQVKPADLSKNEGEANCLIR